MSARRIRTVQTEELEPDRLSELTSLCAAAFDEPPDGVWTGKGPGLHVFAEDAGRVVAHAMIVDRALHLGDDATTSLDVGYIELVATQPELQGRGHGTAVMRIVGEIIGQEYALGALSTGSNAFYARLGWETWRGPTAVRMADGERVRSPAEDGHVMVLRTPRTPPELSLEIPISVDWRPGDIW
jgi:aminoglycoside 2'-N-acetyltransferase I